MYSNEQEYSFLYFYTILRIFKQIYLRVDLVVIAMKLYSALLSVINASYPGYPFLGGSLLLTVNVF